MEKLQKTSHANKAFVRSKYFFSKKNKFLFFKFIFVFTEKIKKKTFQP